MPPQRLFSLPAGRFLRALPVALLPVALAMAAGVAQRLEADFGLAATGVAGPDWQDGKAPGTVFVACVERRADGSVADSAVEELHLAPEVEDVRQNRAEIRDETVAAALELVLTFL